MKKESFLWWWLLPCRGETHRLVQMAQKISPLYRGVAYDMLLSSGEQVSIALLSMALIKRGLESVPLLGYQAGIQTDHFFSRARIQSIKTNKLQSILKEGKIPLVAGFQGITKEGFITTLGRGGSDLTAVALAVVLKQNVCEIYTDVEGVFTGDPQLIPKAKKRDKVEFSEMMEMASLGSRVLQLRSVEMGAKHNVKIHVRNSFKSEEGTWIVGKEDMMESSVVSAIAHDFNQVILRIKPITEKTILDLFTQMGKEDVYVDIISQVETKEGLVFSFSIHKENLELTLKILKEQVKVNDISVIRDVGKLSVIGVGMASHSGVASTFFSVFHKLGVKIHLVTTSEIKISAVLDEKHISRVANELHESFQLSQ